MQENAPRESITLNNSKIDYSAQWKSRIRICLTKAEKRKSAIIQIHPNDTLARSYLLIINEPRDKFPIHFLSLLFFFVFVAFAPLLQPFLINGYNG